MNDENDNDVTALSSSQRVLRERINVSENGRLFIGPNDDD